MNAAVGLMDGLGLDGDRCIRVIPRQGERRKEWRTKNIRKERKKRTEGINGRKIEEQKERKK